MNFLKYPVREEIKGSSLNPFEDEDLDKVNEIHKYLAKFITLEEEYEFDDQDADNLYKSIKRLRLPRDLYDRVGFIVFTFIFDENILK